ncbi:nitroreductase family protein [Colwelliaceae bacterium BS250]
MSVIQFLINRQSNGFLTTPAPNETALHNIINAAVAVPDHGGLTPYHFHIIQGAGLDKLTNIYIRAIKAVTDDSLKIAKAQKMAYRAPLMIVISTKFKQHPKVPKQEQLITAGCAAQAMQMAAVAQGFGAMWRTGDLAYSDIVKSGLGIALDEEIVGFLYIGTKTKELPIKNRTLCDDHIDYWR